MSLINDALKRANQTEPPPPSIPAPALQPVEHQHFSKLPLILFPLLLLSVLTLAVWFFAKGWEVARHAYRSQTDTPVAARETQSQIPPSAMAMASTAPEPAPDVAPSPPKAQTPAPLSTVPARLPPVKPEPVPTPPPQPTASTQPPAESATPHFPDLKLQAVFFRPSSPSVVINSKTLLVGGMVNGARVVSITAESVTVEWEGQTRELTLP